MKPDESQRANLLVNRLRNLAQRLELCEELNPTALLCIRYSKLYPSVRLKYRAQWIERMIGRRREAESTRVLELLDAARILIADRQGNLDEASLARNMEQGLQVAEELRSLQPGCPRVSRYCSRRNGDDTELLAVEFFARAASWPLIDGTEDYLAAMYCICRQPDLRFKLSSAASASIREFAAAWEKAASQVEPSRLH